MKARCKFLTENELCCKKPPIKFEGAGCLVYNYIAKFMGTKRRTVAVKRDIAVNFVNYGEADVLTINEGGEDLEATLDVAVRLGGITYSDIQSDIFFVSAEWN